LKSERWKGTASAVPKERRWKWALAPVAAAKAAFDGPWFRRTEARLFHRYKFQTDPLPVILPKNFPGDLAENHFLTRDKKKPLSRGASSVRKKRGVEWDTTKIELCYSRQNLCR